MITNGLRPSARPVPSKALSNAVVRTVLVVIEPSRSVAKSAGGHSSESYNQARGEIMRSIGRMRIISLDEAPAVLEELRKRPPLSPEEIERRRRLSAEENRIVDEMEPMEEDIKDIIRRERGEEPIG
jgi:hypothetical protein